MSTLIWDTLILYGKIEFLHHNWLVMWYSCDTHVILYLQLHLEIQMGNLVNSCEGIEVAFHNSMRYAVNYLASESLDTSLEVLC